MRKLGSLLLITLLLLVGCSEKEYQQEEIIVEDVEEVEVEVVEVEDKITSLTGKLIINTSELGHGILLDKPVTVNDQKVDRLYFQNQRNILKFLPREHLTYDFNSGQILKEELSGEIPLEIEIDRDNLAYESTHRVGVVKVEQVKKIEDEIKPRDKSENDYPDEYYKDVVNSHILEKRKTDLPKNIKEIPFYDSADTFRNAVDTLLEKDYFIVLDKDTNLYEIEIKENLNTEFILEGVLLQNGMGIKLDKPLEVFKTTENAMGTYTFDELYFSEEEIFKYVPRSDFQYNDPLIELKPDVNFPVKVKVDLDHFMNEYPDYDILKTEDYEILELPDNPNFIDYSHNQYPFDTDNREAYNMSELSEGDEVEGFTVSTLEFNKNDNFKINLKGDKKLTGILTGGFSEMDGEKTFYFEANESFSKPIKFNFEDNHSDYSYRGTIEKIAGEFSPEDKLSEEEINYLLEGNELEVEVIVSDFFNAAVFQSEGFTNITFEELTILTTF